MGSFCSKRTQINKSSPIIIEEETPGNPYTLQDEQVSPKHKIKNNVTHRDPKETILSPSSRPTLDSIKLVPLFKELPKEIASSNSLVSQYLNQNNWHFYRNRRDSGGFGLDLIINLSWWIGKNRSAPELDLKTENLLLDEFLIQKIGCVIPSAECIDVFGIGFLYTIIEQLNYPFKIKLNVNQETPFNFDEKSFQGSSVHSINKHHSWDVESNLRFKNFDLDVKNSNSRLNISVSRNLQDFPFNNGISSEQRKEVCEIFMKTLVPLLSKLKKNGKIPDGRFYTLENIESMQNKNKKDNFIDINSSDQSDNYYSNNIIPFDEIDCFEDIRNKFVNDTFQLACLCRNIPNDRLVWISCDSSIIIYINSLDHFVLETQVKLKEFELGYKYIQYIMIELEKEIAFNYHIILGFLSSSLSRIGCGIQASVSLNMPITPNSPNFKFWMEQHNVIVIEEDKLNNTFILTNSKTLGITEGVCISNLLNACYDWLIWEKELENDSILISDV